MADIGELAGDILLTNLRVTMKLGRSNSFEVLVLSA